MAKDISTAVALFADKLDWTRLERVRGAWCVDAAEVVELTVGPAAAGDGAEAGSETLKRAMARVPERFTLCLESTHVLFRCLTLPTTDAAEVSDMVSLQLDKLLPLPSDEMTVAHETLSNDEVNTVVLAGAAPTAVIAAAAERLGVATDRILRIDVAALAFVRLLREQGVALSSEREAVLLDEGLQWTLVVLDGGVPVLARSAGAAAAAEADVVRTVRLSLLQAEVEQCPRPLERITLVSARPAAEALRAKAAVAFACAVRVLSPADVGSFSRGAALRNREPGALDLRPASWRTSVSDRRFRRGLTRVLGGGALLWVLLAAALYGGPALLDHRAARIEAGMKALEPSGQAVRDVRNRVRMIQAYMDRTLSPLEVLREVSALLPEGIELSSFRYRRDEQRVSVQGAAQSTPLVYEFKQRMDASPLFAETALVSGPTMNPKTRGADFELLVLFKKEEL
jgi:hypothetical protein